MHRVNDGKGEKLYRFLENFSFKWRRGIELMGKNREALKLW